MKFRFPNLPRSDAPQMPLAGNDEPAAASAFESPTEIKVPFGQLSIYEEARREEKRWIRQAKAARFRLRMLTLLFISISVAIMLLDGFSNRSALMRGGKTADSDVSISRLESHPQYVAEKAARDSRSIAINAEIVHCNEKVALYSSRGEQGRMTAWLNRIAELEREKAALNERFNDVTANLKADADATTVVNTDDEFYSLLAFALPLMVFLCAFGAEKAEDGMRGMMLFATYLIQIFNSYLTATAIAHGHPDPAVNIFGSEASVIGILAFVVILFGEPTAFVVTSRMILKYIGAWHETLQDVFEKQRAFIAFRNTIRDDVKDARIAIVHAEQEIARAYYDGQKAVIDQSAETAARQFTAATEVQQQAASAAVNALIPRGLGATELAKFILEKEATGEWEKMRKEGVTNKMLAEANGMTSDVLNNTLARERRKRDESKVNASTLALATIPPNGAADNAPEQNN